jgi:hypothetical protein
MTRQWYRAAVLLLVMSSSGCRDDEPVRQYAQTHAATLAVDARPLWVKYQKLAADVPATEYTQDMRALKPDRVSTSDAGMWLYINTRYPYVTGVFIRYDPAFPTPASAPPDSVVMTYEHLAGEVFWFSMPR